MKVKCEYCNSDIEATLDKCPNCAAPNVNIVRMTADTPGTIEELKMWYQSKKLPDAEVTRFFIGKDIKEPRALYGQMFRKRPKDLSSTRYIQRKENV